MWLQISYYIRIQMRVIAGKFKGKPLFAPKGNRVRPTTDRIKETLFSMLYSKGYAESNAVLDLFSGSGALGIEALSRGAKACTFVDCDKNSIALVKKNLDYAGTKQRVIHADFKKALSLLENQKHDIIFVDPPFNEKLEKSIIDNILKFNVLADDGIVVIEHDIKNDIPALITQFNGILSETRECGSTALTFITKEKKD